MAQPKSLPFNKDNYRYYLAEDDLVLCREYFHKINVSNCKEAHKRCAQFVFLKRKLIPERILLSDNDRAPQLKVTNNNLTVTGEKGYSMIRANHGVNRGKFYYEVRIDKMPEPTAARIGWSQCHANLQAPLGYDHFGYSYRSRFGTKFHIAKGQTYDKNGGYKQGDLIGCMIELPVCSIRTKDLPPSVKETCYVLYTKNKKDISTKLEEHEKPPSPDTMERLAGSKISFFKNGKALGPAYTDIYAGFYYPTISLYKSCTVSINFGPKFEFAPDDYATNGSSNGLRTLQIPDNVALDTCLADLIYLVSEECPVMDENFHSLPKEEQEKRNKFMVMINEALKPPTQNDRLQT